MISGFLDPSGLLHPCPHWSHTSKAEQIVDELNIKRVTRFDTCEDVLLKNGWICIRASDVFKQTYGYNGELLYITDEQQEYFAKNRGEFNMRQLAFIDDLIRDFGKLYQRHGNKSDGGT